MKDEWAKILGFVPLDSASLRTGESSIRCGDVLFVNPLDPFPSDRAKALREAIHDRWAMLTRDPAHLLAAARDPKMPQDEMGRVWVYVSEQEELDAIRKRLEEADGSAATDHIELRYLPAETSMIRRQGLLWLPGAYVVPGGRFNEFYGWDSCFIQRGLWRDGHEELALSMCEQALYEVRHYGMLLNANRTYYLTRSHPPMLGSMVGECYGHTRDREWLENALPEVLRAYHYWMVPPHINQGSGLSRYRDYGHGPAPEVLLGEIDDNGRNHYERVRDYLATADLNGWERERYYDEESNALTANAYLNDRSMRESGFDISHRFGPMNLEAVHFAPVCLNAFLWIAERELADFYAELGQDTLKVFWRRAAERRAERYHAYFWDEAEGLFFDYHLGRRERYPYPFLTTFLPLWAGLATPQQAARVAGNMERFLAPGGLRTSLRVTGCQWDAPFAWAPLHLFAVGGLVNYGFAREARDVARRFLGTVDLEFRRNGRFLEKYDAFGAGEDVEAKLEFGYTTNEVGFGWTNAVVLEFLDFLETGKLDTPMK